MRRVLAAGRRMQGGCGYGVKAMLWIAVAALVSCVCKSWAHGVAQSPASTGELRDKSSADRFWSIRDLVEIREIVSVAISDHGRHVAFILKEPAVDPPGVHYSLNVVDFAARHPYRRIAYSSYLADVTAHPGSDLWTLRGDFGSGVQLYDLSEDGRARPLVVTSTTAKVGTWDGVIAGLDAPHETGVISYEWAPDGSALWYSKLRLRTESERRATVDKGLVYDERKSDVIHFRTSPGLLLGTELRVLTPGSNSDRLLAFSSSSAATDLGAFRRDWSSALWEQDSRHVQYTTTLLDADGGWQTSAWRVDTLTIRTTALPAGVSIDDRAPAPSGTGYLTVNSDGQTARLVQVGADGVELRDFGAVAFNRIGMDSDLGSWRNDKNQQVILAVHYPDRDGIVSVPESRLGRALRRFPDSLSHCSFTQDLQFGACRRESVSTPAEIVAVREDGSVATIARPNEEYARIRPLRIQATHWTNRYSNSSAGYITYPRNYQPGKKYPAIVVTHGTNARNKFADEEFQAEFPLQVFAELDYFVLSVNEPYSTRKAQSLLQFRTKQAIRDGVATAQFEVGLDAVATMEAAMQAAMDAGLVDEMATAIVGYSRGAEVAALAMSQSKLFKAACLADGGSNADGYWAFGSKLAPVWNRALYGGSPYDSDEAVLQNYRRFSPSFRGHEFAGPVLQLFPAATASLAFELHRALEDARVPTELVYFPDESHIFWNPVRRMAAMSWSIDWLNFWLLDRRDASPEKRDRYDRWSSMKREFLTEHPELGSPSSKSVDSTTVPVSGGEFQ